jgi:hypothetical protein
VARQPRRWAPLVAKSIPFDVAPTGAGAIAVGYARSPDEAVGLEVDLATGAVAEKFSRKETSPVARVYPMPRGEERFVVATTGQEGLRAAVQVPGPTPFALGFAAGALSAADRQDAQAAAIWPLAGEEEPEALRVMPAGGRGYAIRPAGEGGGGGMASIASRSACRRWSARAAWSASRRADGTAARSP